MLNSKRTIIKRIIYEYCQRQKCRQDAPIITSIEELENKLSENVLESVFDTLLETNLEPKNIDILKMRCGNYTYKEIGEKHNVTAMYAREIFFRTMRFVSSSEFVRKLYYSQDKTKEEGIRP